MHRKAFVRGIFLSAIDVIMKKEMVVDNLVRKLATEPRVVLTPESLPDGNAVKTIRCLVLRHTTLKGNGA